MIHAKSFVSFSAPPFPLFIFPYKAGGKAGEEGGQDRGRRYEGDFEFQGGRNKTRVERKVDGRMRRKEEEYGKFRKNRDKNNKCLE